MKNKQPTISVIMPVYNAEKYVGVAIESILNQTYTDFEFIIVDDSSTDSSWEIIKKYARLDKRIKIYRNPTNVGAARTADRTIAFAKGKFLARMDADDIAFPDRFVKQLAFLKTHTKYVAVGGQCVLIDSKGNHVGQKTFPIAHEEIYSYIYKFIPVQQPALMIAKSRLPKTFDYYRHGMSPVEDVEFIFKLLQCGKIANLSDFVLQYRIHETNSSRQNLKKSFFLTFISRVRAVLCYGYHPTFQGIAVSLLQLVTVGLLPERMIFFVYMTIKGNKFSTFLPGFNKQVISIRTPFVDSVSAKYAAS